MAYSQITQAAFLSAALVFAVLSITLYLDARKKLFPRALAFATAFNTFSLVAIAQSFSEKGFSPVWVLLIESLAYSIWIYAICKTLAFLHGPSRRQRLLTNLGYSLVGLLFVLGLLSLTLMLIYSVWIILGLAIVSLVATEQLYRNSFGNRYIKLISLCLACLFLYNIYLYTHTLIFQKIDPLLWQARAAIAVTVGVFLIVGIVVLSHRGQSTFHLAPSQSVAFYTTSLTASGILITILALGGMYVRNFGGSWGTIFYSLLLASAGLSLATVFVSSSIRSHLAVLVNKHLFRYKYDHRTEWLNLINYLNQPEDGDNTYRRCLYAISSIVKSPGGAVWINYGSYLEPVYQEGLGELELEREPTSSPFSRAFKEAEWVYFPDSGNDQALSQYNDRLPEWVKGIDNLWLLFPLLAMDKLVGFVALTKPTIDRGFSWEDLDMLKTVGRQLANYLKTHQQADQLAEAKQIDTYNKLVHFIIHDINNLIAQQALVVKNAEKHKNNPAFIDDAIATISNSVERMNRLLKKLRQSSTTSIGRLVLSDVVVRAVEDCQQKQPLPELSSSGCDCHIEADEIRLVMAISHFINNAQEATDNDGFVKVEHSCDCKGHASIVITDNGSGMDWDFIHNRLFKAFDSTKSGMGIGVYLSREYINELGGSLDVLSKPDKGSTFTVNLTVSASSGMYQYKESTGQ